MYSKNLHNEHVARLILNAQLTKQKGQLILRLRKIWSIPRQYAAAHCFTVLHSYFFLMAVPNFHHITHTMLLLMWLVLAQPGPPGCGVMSSVALRTTL